VLDVLGADDDLLCRSVAPRRPARRLGYPAPGPTHWRVVGHVPMPDRAWCSTPSCHHPSRIYYPRRDNGSQPQLCVECARKEQEQ
jgi:hypothetical protein